VELLASGRDADVGNTIVDPRQLAPAHRTADPTLSQAERASLRTAAALVRNVR
jgi:hypothetical protein